MNWYKLWTAILICFVLGFANRVVEQEAQINSMTALQVAREGKTDKEWYEKHRMKGGSSAQAKTPQADR